MDAFQILTRGSELNKSKHKHVIERFSVTHNADAGMQFPEPESGILPKELDFFKYTQHSMEPRGALKRKNMDVTLLEEGHYDDKRRKLELECSQSPQIRYRAGVKGTKVPAAAFSFHDLAARYAIPPYLITNLEANGYRSPTVVQSHACPILLEKRDIIAISPTGTGKTLSYLLPIFVMLEHPMPKQGQEVCGRGVRALILAPTNELAHQIHNECKRLAVGRKWKVVLFTKATANTLSEKDVRDKIDLIISTPLRLVSAVQSSSLELHNVRHLILDEADRLLDPEFLSQVGEIVAACTHPLVQKAIYSATLPAGAEKTAFTMSHDPIRVVVGLKDTPLPLISQSLTYVHSDSSKLPTLVTYLLSGYEAPILIFVSTQARTSSLAEQLVVQSMRNVDCLHAGMTDKQRRDAVQRMLAGGTWILVTTEVMARGMDFKGVRGVINYDFPTSVQSYIHRIGRTGRAGQEGKAITYFTDDDAPYLKSIANVLLQSGSSVPEWIMKLSKASKMQRRLMGKAQNYPEVNLAASIGKARALRQRNLVANSKRRKLKALPIIDGTS